MPALSLPRVSPIVLSWALGVTFSLPSRGEERCAQLEVKGDAAVLQSWPELPGRVRNWFSTRPDIDPCAHVEVAMAEPGLEVRVVLKDGRVASRRVSGRDEIIPTLEALLLVPRKEASNSANDAPAGSSSVAHDEATEEAEEPSPLSKKPAGTNRPATARSSPPPQKRASAAPVESSDSHRGIEFSAFAGWRLGDGQKCIGLGAMSLVDLDDWLLGFAGRADIYSTMGGEQLSTLQLAMLGGHRFRFEAVSFDLIAGPAIVVREDSNPSAHPVGVSGGNGDNPSAVPRLLLASHVNFPSSSVLRGFVGFEAEFGSTGVSDASDVDSAPHLPAWMVGFALGGTVGTP